MSTPTADSARIRFDQRVPMRDGAVSGGRGRQRPCNGMWGEWRGMANDVAKSGQVFGRRAHLVAVERAVWSGGSQKWPSF